MRYSFSSEFFPYLVWFVIVGNDKNNGLPVVAAKICFINSNM